MKRLFCFFAVALLVLLASLPAVTAAKVWDLLPYKQPSVKMFAPNQGDTILMVQRDPALSAGYWLFGKIKIPAGCLIIHNTGNVIGMGDSVFVGEPIPARPVRILGTDDPEAKKILAELGITQYTPSDRDGTGWRIRGGYARFTNIEARGVTKPFMPDAGGADLRICDSKITAGRGMQFFTLADRNDTKPINVETARVEFKTTGEGQYPLWIEIDRQLIYTDSSSVFGGPVVVQTNGPTSTGRARFIGSQGLQFAEPAAVAEAQKWGLIVVQSPKSTLVGDFDSSGQVDFDDFFLFAAAFGQPTTGDNAKFDLSPNGQIDFDDFFLFAAAFGAKAGKPIALLGNSFPNPCNPATTIPYGLTSDAPVTLRVYNILGQVVRTLIDERQTKGLYSVRWDGRDQIGRSVASGMYIFRFDAEVFSNTQKVTLLK